MVGCCFWLLLFGCCFLIVDCWFVVGGWWLVVVGGCFLRVCLLRVDRGVRFALCSVLHVAYSLSRVGRWLFVVGCWQLVLSW